MIHWLNSTRSSIRFSNLAETWDLSGDQLTWTFKLREGVKWHDGEPLTSEDVKLTYEYMLESGLGMYCDFVTGIESIECPDEHTVVIKTEKPKANMLMNPAPILPMHIWKDVPIDELETWPNDNPIGTGPFKFTEFKQGEYIKLTANDDYFLGRPKIDEVVFILYANKDTMVQSLKIGELDVALNINPNQVEPLKQEENINVISADALGFTELSFNCWTDPASKGNKLILDKRVRQSFEWAMDKQQLLEVAYAGQGSPGTTLVPPDGFWHYEPSADELRDYNVDKAKELLESAGYTDKDGDGIREDSEGNKLSFVFLLRAENAEEVKLGQMIAGMVKEVGIELKIETVDDGVLMDRIVDGDFDMFIWGWGSDVDPTTILGIMASDQIGNLNDCNYSNPEFDQMLEEQATIMDENERQLAVWEMQRIIYEDAPYVILFYDNSLQAVRTDKWTGWKQIPEDGPYFFNLTNYNYLNIEPVAAQEPAAAEKDVAISPTTIVLIIVVLAIVISQVKKKKKA